MYFDTNIFSAKIVLKLHSFSISNNRLQNSSWVFHLLSVLRKRNLLGCGRIFFFWSFTLWCRVLFRIQRLECFGPQSPDKIFLYRLFFYGPSGLCHVISILCSHFIYCPILFNHFLLHFFSLKRASTLAVPCLFTYPLGTEETGLADPGTWATPEFGLPSTIGSPTAVVHIIIVIIVIIIHVDLRETLSRLRSHCVTETPGLRNRYQSRKSQLRHPRSIFVFDYVPVYDQ